VATPTLTINDITTRIAPLMNLPLERAQDSLTPLELGVHPSLTEDSPSPHLGYYATHPDAGTSLFVDLRGRVLVHDPLEPYDAALRQFLAGHRS
jgi:hypothetical protein